MAKKQEAAAKKPKTAPRAKPKPTMFDNAEAPASAPPAGKKRAVGAASQRELSNEAIGAAAGQVWSALAEGRGQTLAALKKSVDAPDDHVMLALGWLAREDKLAFDTNGRTVTVSLR